MCGSVSVVFGCKTVAFGLLSGYENVTQTYSITCSMWMYNIQVRRSAIVQGAKRFPVNFFVYPVSHSRLFSRDSFKSSLRQSIFKPCASARPAPKHTLGIGESAPLKERCDGIVLHVVAADPAHQHTTNQELPRVVRIVFLKQVVWRGWRGPG